MFINSTGEVGNTHSLENSVVDNYRINFNNVYRSNNKTHEHLEWYRDNVLHVQNKLMQLHELLCPDYFPDWKNNNESKFYLYYNYGIDIWYYDYQYSESTYVVYFTEEAAEKACEILNRENFMVDKV